MKDMTLSDFENLYRDRKFVGSGGFAEVYKTFDHAKGCYVALKSSRVRPEHRQYTLQREVELVNKLQEHPNVARYESCYRFDMGLAGEMDFAVLEFYEDGNLEQFLNRHSLTPEETRAIVNGILRGVGFLHQNNITHRDLKSQNILIKREHGIWSPKIADFGLAREVFDQVITDTSIGLSYAYAAPEQIRGQKIFKSVDIWAVGVIVYRIIAGELPFKNQDNDGQNSQAQSELIRKITTLELPEKLNTLPEPYQTMIRRCLVLDPLARAQTTQELLELLDFRLMDNSAFLDKTQFVPRPSIPLEPPVRQPVVEEDKTELIRPVEEFVPKVQESPVPAPPPIYVPPTNYIQPKADVTQYVPDRKQELPPPPAPTRPVVNMGEPKRSLTWLWVLLSLLLLGGAFCAYWFLLRESEPQPTFTPKTFPNKAVQQPTNSTAQDDWTIHYSDAMISAEKDIKGVNKSNTFLWFAHAAELAIMTNRTQAMSTRMAADANRAIIKRLNQGRNEWQIIDRALKQKDRKLLKPILGY